MPGSEEATERTQLLLQIANDRRLSVLRDEDAESVQTHFTKGELALSGTAVGERLPYNSYSTIDFLHDMVKDSFRHRSIHKQSGLRYKLLSLFDSAQGWIAAALIGALTAVVAYCVDISVATVSDWKLGHCKGHMFEPRESCEEWIRWATWWPEYPLFVGLTIVFAVFSSSITMLTKKNLPQATVLPHKSGSHTVQEKAKVMYMAAGSGIPEIKTILSGFVISHFLGLKVLVVKAIGAIFAVSAILCLGKEGPFVHISACVGHLVASQFPKYRDNGRKMREILGAAVAAGLSVAFGAPIGGVLFAYEEICTYFPRKVMWRAFLCSLTAAVVLKALNPTGTGKLVLFEATYGDSSTYNSIHYLVFILLGIVGGIFGGLFCKLNFLWGKLETEQSRCYWLIVQRHQETEPGSVGHESGEQPAAVYTGWLIHGTLSKLILTVITFGIKVPSGVIIPSLDAGAFFGRLIGAALVPALPPGVFAMVGSAAFLAGVSRMTISLCVVMFELTGSLEFVVPHMVAILTAKWVADALEKEGVYDLAQSVLGHPFLDDDACLQIIRDKDHPPLVEDLIPPAQTMEQITVALGPSGVTTRAILEEKVMQLEHRGLMDAGLVLTRDGNLAGYFPQGEIEFALSNLSLTAQKMRLLASLDPQDDHELASDDLLDLTMFVDRTPLSVVDKAPMEFAVEMFSKLGLRYLCITKAGSGELAGVVIKKRLVAWLEKAKEGHH